MTTRITHQPIVVCGPFDVAELSGESFVAMNIRPGSLVMPWSVLAVITDVLTGSDPQIFIGDGDANDEYWDIRDTTIGPGVHGGGAVSGGAIEDGKFYADADVLTVTVSSETTAGTFFVIARIYELASIVT